MRSWRQRPLCEHHDSMPSANGAGHRPPRLPASTAAGCSGFTLCAKHESSCSLLPHRGIVTRIHLERGANQRVCCFQGGSPEPSPPPATPTPAAAARLSAPPTSTPNLFQQMPRISAQPQYPQAMAPLQLQPSITISLPSSPVQKRASKGSHGSSPSTSSRVVVGQGTDAAADTPSDNEPRWLHLFKALLAHVGRVLHALAITFCLLALMLMRPRAVGAAHAMHGELYRPTAACAYEGAMPATGSSSNNRRAQGWPAAMQGLQARWRAAAEAGSQDPHGPLHSYHMAALGWLPALLAGQVPGPQATLSTIGTAASASSASSSSQPHNTLTGSGSSSLAPSAPAAARHGHGTDTHPAAAPAAGRRSGRSRPPSAPSALASISLRAAAGGAAVMALQELGSSYRGGVSVVSVAGSSSSSTSNPVVGQLAEAVEAHHHQAQEDSTGDHAAGATGPAGAHVQVLSSAALLAAQEAAVVGLFRSAQASVVNISGARAAGTFSSLDLSRMPVGQGSGFVWDERGHVVTAYSCVRGAAEVKVTLADASSFTAKLVGHDAGKDLAVLRLSMPKARLKELAPVKLAGTAAGGAAGAAGAGTAGAGVPLAVGASVWALGNASGLDHTLTQGVVSGLGRELPGGGPYPLKGLIQTDAACGHQAGGVILNKEGRVVGMVVAPGQAGGRAAGYALGYALPVEALKGLVTQILLTGKPSRPTLGITLAPPQVLASQGVDGVLVLEVPPGSPAAAAGIRHTHRDIFGDVILGDVIVGIEGGSVRHAGDLYAALDARKAGDRVRLDVLRDGKATSLTLVLGERGAAGALEE